MTRAIAIAITLALVAGAACIDSPTGPSALPGGGAGLGAAAPDVAGTYRGPITLTITDAPGARRPMRDTGDFTVRVRQDGSTVTISATARWPWGNQTVWTDKVGTIDALGTWTGPVPASFTDPTCGYVTYRRTRIAFVVGTMTYAMLADTELCGWFEYDAHLTRQ